MSLSDHTLELARLQCVLRTADVRDHGWSPQLLIWLHQTGKLHRLVRGMYALPDAEITDYQKLDEVCPQVLRMTCLRGPACCDGILTVPNCGAPIRVGSAAETATGYLKFRDKIGLGDALGAHRDTWHHRNVTMAALSHFTRINRVERVIRPYLEAVAG